MQVHLRDPKYRSGPLLQAVHHPHRRHINPTIVFLFHPLQERFSYIDHVRSASSFVDMQALKIAEGAQHTGGLEYIAYLWRGRPLAPRWLESLLSHVILLLATIHWKQLKKDSSMRWSCLCC